VTVAAETPSEYVQTGPPRRFTAAYKTILLARGLVAVLIIIVALPLLAFSGREELGFLLLSATLGLMMLLILFMPWIDGTRAYRRWFRRELREGRETGRATFLTEINLEPPLVGGWEKRVDNADDVGVLTVEPDALRYEGDAVRFRIARTNVIGLMSGTTFHKGWGFYGRTYCLQLRYAVDGRYRISFLAREGASVLSARRRGRALGCELQEFVESEPTPAPSEP
jgi:hypothetical protein